MLYNRLTYEVIDGKNLTIDNVAKTSATASAKNPVDYEITLENSVFEGVNKDQRLYVVAAQRAIKDEGEKYKLFEVNAKYGMDNYKDLVINAHKGIIDRENRFVKLSDEVQMILDDFVFRTHKIEIDLLNKQVLADSKVKVTYKHSNIAADSFSTANEGNVLNFDGHVATKINISDF